MWEPPLFEDQNGIITSYIINVVLNETAENFQLSTAESRLFLDSLRPFGTYSFVIAAQTIAGIGPFSTVLTIATPEDSELCMINITTVLCEIITKMCLEKNKA